MMEGDLCPACGQRNLPKISENSRITARRCQNENCARIFEIPLDSNSKPDGRPDLDE